MKKCENADLSQDPKAIIESDAVLLDGQSVGTVTNNNKYLDMFETPLTVACSIRPTMVSIVNALLEHGADPNRERVHPPLFVSLRSNNADLIELLVEYGADVQPFLTILDRSGDTMLTGTCRRQQYRLAKVLPDNKADPDHVNSKN